MMSGTWSERDGRVRLGAVAATKRMCLGAGSEIEKRVLAVLGEQGFLVREGARLVATGPDGARFEFAPTTPNLIISR